MAATPTTLTELTDLAKDYFTNVYVQLVNPETPLKGQFARLENAQFTGKKWIFGVKKQIGGASANAAANKSLPPADEGVYDQGEALVVRTYTRMALDGLAIEVTKRQAGSFRPALAETMSDRLQAHDLEVNRQMFCNADGILASVSVAGASSTTQTLLADYGVTNGGTGTRHLYAGDYVAFYEDDKTTLIGRRTVSSVDHTGPSIVVDATVDTTSGTCYVSRATSDTDNITATEAGGLLAAVKDSGTFEAIPGTGQWRATRMHNSAVLRDISDSLVMQMVATLRNRSRLTPDLVVTRPGIVLKYSEIFLPLRRLDGQDVQLKGGYKPIAAIIHAGGAIPVVDDADCPESRMFFLNTGGFRLADLVGTEWSDMDGATFDRVTDKDAIEGYIRKYWQLITVNRLAQGVIEDLNDTSSIDKVA